MYNMAIWQKQNLQNPQYEHGLNLFALSRRYLDKSKKILSGQIYRRSFGMTSFLS